MMINRRTISIRIGLSLLALLGIPLGLIWQAWNQTRHNQALITAVRHKDTNAVLRELQCHADPNSHDEGYPQSFAAFLQRWVQRLNKDNSVKETRGSSALTLAVQNNSASIVQALLTDGAKDTGEQPRMDNGEKNAEVVDGDIVPSTLLMYAAWKGNAEIVHALIRHGSSVRSVDVYGRQALSYATNAATVEALVASGADVNATDKYGGSVARDYVQFDCLESLHALLTHNPKNRSAMFVAAHQGKEECLLEFLAAGWDVDTLDEEGWTPLMLSLFSPGRMRADIAMFLIKHGANVNFRLKDGTIPLLLAADGGRYPDMDDDSPRVVQMLLDRGAQINAKEADGSTPLMTASWRLRPVLVQQLLRQGAAVNARTKNGRSALSMARDSPYKAQQHDTWPLVMRLLKRAGAKR